MMRNFSALLLAVSLPLLLSRAAVTALHDEEVIAKLEERDEWQTSLPYSSSQQTSSDSDSNSDAGLLCLYLTNGVDWTGEGQNICAVPGSCASMLPDGLTANTSSAGPDAETATCYLYANEKCGGERSAPIRKPGVADLGEMGFERRARSWRCWTESANGGGEEGESGNDSGRVSVEISTTLSAGAGQTSSSSSSSSSPSSSTATSSSAALPIISVTGGTSPTMTSPSAVPFISTTGGTAMTASVFDSSRFPSPTTSPTNTTLSTSVVLPIPTTPNLTSSISRVIPTLPTPPGLGSSTTFFTLTHTYADGSTTIIATFLVEPIPPTTTGSRSSSLQSGGFVTVSPGNPAMMSMSSWTSTATLLGATATLTVTETGAVFAPPS